MIVTAHASFARKKPARTKQSRSRSNLVSISRESEIPVKLKMQGLLCEYSHAEIVARLRRLISLQPHTYDRLCRCDACQAQATLEKSAILTEGKPL